MSVYDELSESQQFACRVIADHARATAFAIADGILPGNEGRNYVLRKIMRRAIYHGREHLGLNDLFFYKVCDFVVGEMSGAYPELEGQRDFIGKMVRIEEERFGTTLTVGLKKLNELIDAKSPDHTIFPHELAPIRDTFGLPTDLIFVVLESRKAFVADFYQEGAVDNLVEDPKLFMEKLETVGNLVESPELFNERLDVAIQSLQKNSDVGHTTRKSQISPLYAKLRDKVGVNEFQGYDATHLGDCKVVAILDGEREIDHLAMGSTGAIVLDKTPFYAEAGGQVGDQGILTGLDKNARISDTFSPIPGLIIHKVLVRVGEFRVGDAVSADVDVASRDATRRNHTATHLVHAALREVLGTHVKQAGSVVGPNVLRFDFTHYQPMTAAEIAEVEDLVNREILKNDTVNTNVMSIEQAMAGGAMALFGEKYGSAVRVLSVGDGVFSKELCGGTHVRATGDIGSFKITGDEAIASGVRRIRAITGFDVLERLRESELIIDRSLGYLKSPNRGSLPDMIFRQQEELKRTRKEMDELKLKIATGSIGDASSGGDEPREINGVKVLAKIVEGLDGGGTRQLSDTLLARLKSGVVIIGRSDEGKVGIIVRVSDDLTGKVKAGDVIREIAPMVGGRGGGKPDMAEGGGTEPDKLSEAIDASYGVIEKMLK